MQQKKYIYCTMLRLFVCLLLMLCAMPFAHAQPCTAQGQTPATAFSLCGNTSFFQPTLPVCRNGGLFVPGCTNQNTSYGDNNPVYYTFTCKNAGTFGFTVSPADPIQDYNWMLYDITGRNPNDIFADKTLVLTGNWSGSTGNTGAAANGINFIQCRSLPVFGEKPTFTAMPLLQTGHVYVLMVSNVDYAGNFSLAVQGGTADISDDNSTPFRSSIAACSNNSITLVFNKKIKCSSIASNGSDFMLQPATASIVAARGINCTNSNETDSIVLTFSAAVTQGQYQISINTGTDGNTLVDRCNNNIASNTTIPVSISPFAVITNVQPNACNATALTLTFSKPVQCNSIAADGSDFSITGHALAQIQHVQTTCNNGYTNSVILQLQQPLNTAGNYTIVCKKGTNGNTFVDECNKETAAGTSTSFRIKPAVDASFTYSISYGCMTDTIQFTHAGGNEINYWLWLFENGSAVGASATQLFTTSGLTLARLVVDNGQCRDTAAETILLPDKLSVDFDVMDTACAGEEIFIVNRSTNATAWSWDFGNNTFSSLEKPLPVTYTAATNNRPYTITLTATKDNCTSSLSKQVYIDPYCALFMPTAFSPNDDGLNDYFGPARTTALREMQLKIFNRYGVLLFQSSAGNTSWNGRYNNLLQPMGNYVWQLSWRDPASGSVMQKKGNVWLLR
ncbi:T9SS type B sorting domain-containing protein [Lacibacter cauensis]|nr:T9SS type B sorting domain-containing protein [Lacibacter cauensis]